MGKNIVVKEIKVRKSTNSKKIDPFSKMYIDDIIQPPLLYSDLAKVVSNSNSLPQLIDAMEQNCEGYGFNLYSTLEEYDKEKYEDLMQQEKRVMKNFFKYISYDMSFTKLRKKVRRDTEMYGNGYIEVIRNKIKDNAIESFEYIESKTIRICKLGKYVDAITHKKEPDSYEYREVKYQKRFRKFVQIVDTEKVYFKEYGDKRFMDYRTGIYTDEDNADYEATEIIWLSINEGVYSVYGVPRWIGSLKSIMGSDAVEGVNLDYFDNKAIPPLAILVSGGSLTEGAEEHISNYIRNNIKGRKNFHSVLVLEAEGQSSPNSLEKDNVKIEMKELSNIKDALFRLYEEDNRKKVRSTFRLPPIYIGYTDDYTRATAEESRSIAEEQVFRPARMDFDFMINQKILPELDIKYIGFETLSSPEDNDADLVQIYKGLTELGLTFREGRQLIGELGIINISDDNLDERWLDLPIKIAPNLLSGNSKTEQENTGDETEEQKYSKLARLLMKARNTIVSRGSDEKL